MLFMSRLQSTGTTKLQQSPVQHNAVCAVLLPQSTQTLQPVGAKPQGKHGVICTVMLHTGSRLNQNDICMGICTDKPKSKSSKVISSTKGASLQLNDGRAKHMSKHVCHACNKLPAMGLSNGILHLLHMTGSLGQLNP